MDDDEVTRRVAPEDLATTGTGGDPEKTELVSPSAAAPTTRPPSPDEEQTRHIAHNQQPTQPAAQPSWPAAPPAQPSPPPQQAPRPQYGPPASPPPHAGPGPFPGSPPPPHFGPGGPANPGTWPGPQQPYGPGTPTPPPGYQPPPPGAPPTTADVGALLAKGGSFIANLMQRGIRGELIRQPAFQNMRRQNPDQIVYVSYGVGLLFSLVLGALPGLIGTLFSDALWVGVAYVLFAVGNKRAHQFVAYGIGLVGAVLFLISLLFTVAAFVDLASLNLAGAALTLVLGGIVTLVSGIALAYLGIQVHREIQRMSKSH